MSSMRKLSSILLLLSIAALPAMAGSNDAKPGTESATNPGSAATPAPASPSLAATAGDANVTALLGVLVMKGVLAPSEANAIRNAAPDARFQLLVDALNRKGLVNAADLSAATGAAVQPSAPPASAAAAPEPSSSSLASPEAALPQQGQKQPGPTTVPPPIAPPSVIPAVAPVRVFPVDPPKSGALVGIKAGPITIAPYGFIKATVIHDSSDPDGDDFPFPGLFLNAASLTNTGPTTDPEFHVKARSTRFGMNFEWPDISKKLTLTGKIEGDFEGNFSEVDNRDVSSIRSNEPQLRLAFVRLDYHASDMTDVFFLGGQDWTLFGSGALPNILETTFLGAYWGDIYERSPQLRGGFVQTLDKVNSVKLEAQAGIMMPSSGQILKLGSLGLAGQLGQGEREGADSDRPEWEGRVALSFQLDHAKGVAPAQIAVSGFYASRTSIAYNSSTAYAALPASYLRAFPNGFDASSHLYGEQLAIQLPTRWFTFVASAYQGADLRFYFGGQINSFATDVSGLTGLFQLPTLDGGPLAAAGGAVLGCTGTFAAGACSGSIVVAKQRPVRGFGGFVNLGLPLSRWFNANPLGHNAGWQLYFDMGKDQANNHDLNNPGYVAAYNGGGTSPLPMALGQMAVVTLYYKVNTWASFGFEQSVYATRMKDALPIYTIAGKPSNEWRDSRTEFGPIFTF
jgi:hypothetical protein